MIFRVPGERMIRSVQLEQRMLETFTEHEAVLKINTGSVTVTLAP